MPTADQTLVPPPSANGGRPQWLDDPDMTKVDFSTLNGIPEAVQQAMNQQMLQRGNTFATDPANTGTVSPPGSETRQQIHPITGEPLDQAPGLTAPVPTPPAPTVSSFDADAILRAQQQADEASRALAAQGQQPATEQPLIPDTFQVRVGTNADGTPDVRTLTQAQALELVQTYSYVAQQPDTVKQQWAAIEAGQAQAVAGEELARFNAWKAMGSPAAAPAAPVRPDMSYLDPEAQAYVARLEAAANAQSRVDQAPGGQGPAYQPAVTAYQPQAPAQPQAFRTTPPDVDGEIRRREQLATVTTATIGRYGLDTAALNHLQQRVADSQIIPRLMQEQATRNPITGAVMNQPDFGTVLNQAYDQVMMTDQSLRPIYESYVASQYLARNQASNATVDGKRALAGSLAHAAPAAVPSIPKDPAHMTPQELRDNISAHLRELQGAGTFGN